MRLLLTSNAANSTQDVSVRVPKRSTIYCVDWTATVAVASSLTGSEAATGQLYFGTPINMYGDNAGRSDTNLISNFFAYVVQRTSTGNYLNNMAKTISGLFIPAPEGAIISLRNNAATNLTVTLDCIIYLK